MKNNSNDLLIKALNFIEKMLLLNKIEIFDIPKEIRNSSTSLYITACRTYRNSNISKYQDVLTLLNNDIDTVKGEDKIILIRLKKNLQDNMYFIEEQNEKTTEKTTLKKLPY